MSTSLDRRLYSAGAGLTAYYDLSVSPPTYDFVSFLLAAEMYRVAVNEDALEVRILPGPARGFRLDRLPPQDVAVREHMLSGIVMAMTKLLPSCTGCVRQGDRASAGGKSLGYGTRYYGTRFLLEAARMGIYPLRFPGPVSPTGYVTITLREASYHPTRNSNLGEWVKVARWLQCRGHQVIFVRDTERADEPLEDLPTAPQASRDLLARAQLYTGAALNLFVSNGPAWLCLFMGAPTLIVKMLAPGVKGASAEFLSRVGFAPGSVWPNLGRRQCVSWADDNADQVIAVVEGMLQCE